MMATSSELLFRDLLNEPMHFCLARLERLKKQSLYYLIIKNGGVITGAEVDTCSRTIILVRDSDTYYSNYIDGVPTFKASYINECIEKERILDISQFVMSNVFIADENFSYMDVVYKRKYEWIKLLPSLKILKIETKPMRSRFQDDGLLPIPTEFQPTSNILAQLDLATYISGGKIEAEIKPIKSQDVIEEGKIEMNKSKTSRFQDDGLLPTPIEFVTASTILAQLDHATYISGSNIEAEIVPIKSQNVIEEGIPHRCQFKCGVQAVTAKNLRLHYLMTHGADFYTACCYCSAKCFSSEEFLMHIKQCRFGRLYNDGKVDLYWKAVKEVMCYKMTRSKLAYNYLIFLLRSKNRKPDDLRYPPHLFEKKTKLEYVWRLGHCALAKWAETNPDVYDGVFLLLEKGRLDSALSKIPSKVFSTAFKEAMKGKYSKELPENLCYMILQPCHSECTHPYPALDLNRVHDGSKPCDETAATNDNSLETAQNASIENPERVPIPKPNSLLSVD